MSCRLIVATLIFFANSIVAAAAEISVEKSDQGAVVKIDGELLTEYLIKSGNKPVMWPLVAPGGKRITRGYPIEPAPGETQDHIHQRGLWFTHGDVNRVVFWNQEKGSGEIVHREFLKLDGNTISTRNDWLAPDGKKVCSDTRTFRFSGDGDTRTIDVKIVVHADEGDVHFGDNKEGSFGLRVADSMRADVGGKIINSEGVTNANTWGQKARWVDYQGHVQGEQLGVAILDHPKNHNHPTRWHVRGYGLFAANPFFQKAVDPSLPEQTLTVPKGESLTLRYQVILHHGDEKVGHIAERFEEFSRSPTTE
jgi:hypothetical protein